MAEENKQNEVMTVLKTPILLLVLVLVAVGYLISTQLAPKISNFMSIQADCKTALEAYQTKEQTLEQLKAQAKAPKKTESSSSLTGVSKALFRPLEAGLDTESILAAEFDEILALITANQIKTKAVVFTPDPADDNFIKGNATKFSACKLDMEMIATYTNFKNFMKELYKHEHYLDIAKVEIVPYNKNKTILLINLQLKLYAERI